MREKVENSVSIGHCSPSKMHLKYGLKYSFKQSQLLEKSHCSKKLHIFQQPQLLEKSQCLEKLQPLNQKREYLIHLVLEFRK